MNHHHQDQNQKPAQASSKAMFEGKNTNIEGGHEPLFTADDVIHVYTRAQALADGVLVDVSQAAREAGFRIPVALTRAAWADCVEWTEADEARKATTQDEAGRLWDVVWMAHLAARTCGNVERCTFDLYRVPREGRGNRPRRVSLVMQIGPGDTAEPVITIMLPHED